MNPDSHITRSFVRSRLPWLVFIAALVFYCATLNRWVSLLNIGNVGRVAGWMWQSDLASPAYWLVTLPVKLLPAKWIPLALNLLSALFGAAVLGLVARCVALLPHDRTHEQRQREMGEHSFFSGRLAWLPPIFAALALGLQMSFWEHSTNATAETFDLLLFVYVIRCLLEFRVDEEESWLTRAALVFGAGMAESFSFTGFFPVFVAALLWIRGVGFFNVRFLLRVLGFGLAGLLVLVLLQPIASSFSQYDAVSFWQALKVAPLEAKNFLASFFFNKFALISSGKPFWVLAITSLLPCLAFSVRWPTSFGDSSQIGAGLTTVMFHFTSALFLVICAWVCFDPAISGRAYAGYYGCRPTFLSLYLLASLGVGYFSGYFLIVFGQKYVRGKPEGPARPRLHVASCTAVACLLAATASGLLYKNLPPIRDKNGPAMLDFASRTGASLPAGGILLADFWPRQFIAQAWLARAGREKEFMAVDTQSLRWPGYQRFLRERHPGKLTAMFDTKKRDRAFTPPELLAVVVQMAEAAPLCYVHPSFGYYFERLRAEPHGMIYRLVPNEISALIQPPHPAQLVAENEKFWDDLAAKELPALVAGIAPHEPGRRLTSRETFFKRLHLPPERNAQAIMLGWYYSRSLTSWGAEAQRAGKLASAARDFDLAIRLNPENVVAKQNLDCNALLRAGLPTPVLKLGDPTERFGIFRSWDRAVGECGPYDAPSFCYSQAYVFLQTGLYRQAAENFNRARQFDPNHLPTRLWLAQLYLIAGQPDHTLEFTDEIAENASRFGLSSSNRVDLMTLRSSAFAAKQQPEKIQPAVESIISGDPTNLVLLSIASTIYSQQGDFTNALSAVDRYLKHFPDDATMQVNRSYALIQMGRFDDAVNVLTRVIDTHTNEPTALINRAIAHLKAGHLDKAQADYEDLQRIYPTSHQVAYGLAEIAWRRRDTNTAIAHYEAYLVNAPTNTAEARLVGTRLDQLRGKPAK